MPAMATVEKESIAKSNRALASMVTSQTVDIAMVAIDAVLLLFLLGFINVGYRRVIHVPLNDLSNFLGELANGNGDLGVNLDNSRCDEIGEIGSTFNRFKDKIAVTIDSVVDSIFSIM